MIVIIGCNKGGAGKTTLATNIAVGLARRELKVCILDGDPQMSASKWHIDRNSNQIYPNISLKQKLENLSTVLPSFKKQFDFVIVDVAGRNSRELITAGAVADMIIAPHQASQLDLDTLEELQIQTLRLKEMNPKLAVYIYQAMASTNPAVKRTERTEFLEYLSDLKGFKPLNSIGYYRKVYRDVISEGKSVLESVNKTASNEIEQLIHEVFG